MIVARFTVVCMFDPLTDESPNAPYPSDLYINNREPFHIFAGIFYGMFLPGIYLAGVSISTIVIVKLGGMARTVIIIIIV